MISDGRPRRSNSAIHLFDARSPPNDERADPVFGILPVARTPYAAWAGELGGDSWCTAAVHRLPVAACACVPLWSTLSCKSFVELRLGEFCPFWHVPCDPLQRNAVRVRIARGAVEPRSLCHEQPAHAPQYRVIAMKICSKMSFRPDFFRHLQQAATGGETGRHDPVERQSRHPRFGAPAVAVKWERISDSTRCSSQLPQQLEAI